MAASLAASVVFMRSNGATQSFRSPYAGAPHRPQASEDRVLEPRSAPPVQKKPASVWHACIAPPSEESYFNATRMALRFRGNATLRIDTVVLDFLSDGAMNPDMLRQAKRDLLPNVKAKPRRRALSDTLDQYIRIGAINNDEPPTFRDYYLSWTSVPLSSRSKQTKQIDRVVETFLKNGAVDVDALRNAKTTLLPLVESHHRQGWIAYSLNLLIRVGEHQVQKNQ
jgi:hypothetical protein